MEESLRMEENFEKEKSLKKETTAGMEDSLRMIADSFPLDAQKVRTYSALSFAYIGDSVYDLIIRTMITTRGNTKPNKYHRQVIEYVNAGAQTQMMERIKPYLNDEDGKAMDYLLKTYAPTKWWRERRK